MSEADEDVEEEESGNTIGTYEGERNEKGERHGKGKTVLPNGDNYEGEYMLGKRHGLGTYKFKKNNCRYTGHYQAGRRHGPGTMIYPNGTKYIGEWARNKRDGVGKYIYTNGDTYEGEWRKNKKEGIGTYTFASGGIQYVGLWRNNKRYGYGEIVQPGMKYRGRFKFDVPRGKGRYMMDIGIQVDGESVLLGPKTNDEEEEGSIVGADEDPENLVSKFKLKAVTKFNPYLEPWEVAEKNKYAPPPKPIYADGGLRGLPELGVVEPISSQIDMFLTDKPFSECGDEFTQAEQVVQEVISGAEHAVMDVSSGSLHNIMEKHSKSESEAAKE